MGRKPKSAEVRAVFFTARASGATLRQAAAAAQVSKTTAENWNRQSGGVRPRSHRPRPALRLSVEERETISRGLARKSTLTAIAAELGRPVSTVSREVQRNSGPNGYRAARADRLATLRTARPRAGKLADDEPGQFLGRVETGHRHGRSEPWRHRLDRTLHVLDQYAGPDRQRFGRERQAETAGPAVEHGHAPSVESPAATVVTGTCDWTSTFEP